MIVKTLDHLNLISKKIANKISKKDNIYLFGEIGVGKTTFARNLINNLQLRENVKATNVLSPTYNIMFEYKIKNLKVLHYDFYRLGDMEEIEKLGFFYSNEDIVNIIEWPQLLNYKNPDRLEIYLSYVKNENERELKFITKGKWSELSLNEL